MENLVYPKDFWRGISNKDFVCDGHVLPSAFQFDDEIRQDGFKELSINWNDNEGALATVLNQKKDNGKFQFSVGATNLQLGFVKQCLATYISRDEFSYERKPVEGNDYHGNLLVKGTIDKKIRLIISNTLALAADTNIVYRNEE